MFKSLINFCDIIFQSCVTEFKLFFKDKAAYVSFLGTSVVVVFLYSSIYGHETLQKLPVAIVDQDNSTASRELVRMVDATQGVLIYKNAPSLIDARKLFFQEEVRGILYIPKDFSKKLQRGQAANVSAYCDASYMLYYKSFLNGLSKALGTFNAQLEISNIVRRGTDIRNAVFQRRPVNPQSIALFNPYAGYATFIMPVVCLLILQATLLTAIGIIGGTKKEYNAINKNRGEGIPFNPFPALIGRSLNYLFLSILLMLIILGFCFTLFRLPQRGHLLELLVFLTPYFLSIVFMGIALAALFRKREDVLFVIPFISLPAIFLTGTSWPTVAIPGYLQYISYIFPTTVGVKGFLCLTQFGASLSEIKDIWRQMWLTCLIYFIIALVAEIRVHKKLSLI